MDDNVMYTWEVVSNTDFRTVWVCARLEAAEYMLAWEDAAMENSIFDLERSHPNLDWSWYKIQAETFFIEEGVVIL